MSDQTVDHGVLYIAFGEKYRADCARSIKSLKQHNRNLPVCVITDRDWLIQPKPDIVLKREPILTLLSKPTYIPETPFQFTTFLDTDTYVLGSITELFDLLRFFDIGINFAPQFLRCDPYMLPWCNSGVLVYRMNDDILRAFSLWREMFIDEQNSREKEYVVHGDRFLAQAVARTNIKAIHLAQPLDIFLGEPQCIKSPIRIIHSRDWQDIAAAAKINRGWDPNQDITSKVWIPQLHDYFPTGGLRPPGMWLQDPLIALSVLIRRTARAVRGRLSWGRH
jgi:hypothetical protein